MPITEYFDTPGVTQWVSPITGIVRVRCRGAGGGGGVNSNAEGGGAGGGHSEDDVAVIKDQLYDLTIGLGGDPGVDGGDTFFDDGSAVYALGGPSAFGITGGISNGTGIGAIATAGGSGGDGSAGAGSRAGGGGGGSGGDAGNGDDGGDAVVDAAGPGGTGGATNGAAGGAGGSPSQNGSEGAGPGAGGGGGGKVGGNAASGKNGYISLTYDEPSGYEIYLTEGRTAEPGVDVPVATLANTETQLAISTAGLNANALYRVTVVAFTTVGRSTPAFADFKTDGTGGAVFIPSLVTNLRVTPLVGGQARVSWDYDEQVSDHFADTFSISVTPLEGQAPVVVADVPFVSPLRSYSTTFAGADGLYIVKVFSKRAGAYQAAVSGVYVRLDGTPPTTGISGLEAE